ncbi:hypothetical protein AOLI_G00177420 [Acnodon oligacanthus]
MIFGWPMELIEVCPQMNCVCMIDLRGLCFDPLCLPPIQAQQQLPCVEVSLFAFRQSDILSREMCLMAHLMEAAHVADTCTPKQRP